MVRRRSLVSRLTEEGYGIAPKSKLLRLRLYLMIEIVFVGMRK